ncbi:YpzG family protein [Metabacillus halosaccharovorans]|uniref:YpzG family protein n=1 Tax=Metabacillus halosaccharovorans TaxID=930124 RepID=UPI000994BB55|nr:YpzG family protein [Metabacillus halosaccharovorans]PMC33844.1 YpzG family protein [Bacillus sp. UMB0899]
MGSHSHKKFYDNMYSNPFNQPWANPKHAHAQVNGQTQQSQDLIILKRQTRKQS